MLSCHSGMWAARKKKSSSLRLELRAGHLLAPHFISSNMYLVGDNRGNVLDLCIGL